MQHDTATTAQHPDIASGRSGRPVGARDHVLPDHVGLPTSAAGSAAFWTALLGEPALPASQVAWLASLVRWRDLAAGDEVISHRSPAVNLVALGAGEVSLGLRTADGLFRTERIVRGPGWLDQSSAWVGGQHAMDVRALSAVRVLQLPCDALLRGLPQHPGLAERLIRGLASEVQALAVNTHELMHKDAPARLAQWLRQRCQPVDRDSEGAGAEAVVRFDDRKRDVASQLAITPETLSRLMRSFSSQGVIEVSGYLVRVLDLAALGRLAKA